ncbi:flavohemoglobin expression-modulating QEGLA motif protein [Tahibacter harae]|uniref:Flavohemoglobin expression-modulating QEGLA motif protein n=1 Tax=Tahibacter harae TaxID=2963937 RepID=A0ABT1QZB7_9GAMM|nr:flavohemoglobin expression-modulating QEGLA motif protein [Tahibacter harae]MCQ4167634.1 flavohemoglobin expression-modulating QEGLA motif protein [Tahibacter harae]
MSAKPEAAETRTLDRCTALDARLVAAIRGIRLLQVVSWPASAQQRFIDDWRRGQHKLPQVRYTPPDLAAAREELIAIGKQADPGHPVGDYLRRSAESWRVATELLLSVGSPAVTDHSVHLYGRPGDHLPGSELTNLDAARHFIGLAGELDAEILASEADYCIPAETLQAELQTQLDAFFQFHKISVEIDPDLIAKAAAGPTRIRLRSATCFTEYDRHQLVEHEAFVHSLTGLNGREQPHLKSLGRSSPRVTATQEGLAVFAELISGSIDIERMKRISLRIVAIDMALSGADFIDVFRYFLETGQTEADSFSSAQRVFRGVPVSGGAAFTKDNVYLHGLLTVHTFFRWALKQRRLNLSRALFAGKMTLGDVIALEPYFESGYIAQPLYLPPWAQRANGLAGMLAFSLFANHIRIAAVEADDLLLGV